MKSLLEKFKEKAILPGDRTEERANSEFTSLSIAAQNLFGVERVAKEKLVQKAEQVRADAKFSQYGWKRLSLQPFGWTKGLVNVRPAFSIFRIDDAKMEVLNGSFNRPRLVPDPIRVAYQPTFEIKGHWSAYFRGVIPQSIKETILKAAPLFTSKSDGYNDLVHLYLLCEETSWNNQDGAPQNFVVVGWDGIDLWLIEDYVEPLSFEKFLKVEFPDLMAAPKHLALPEYNPYGGNE